MITHKELIESLKNIGISNLNDTQKDIYEYIKLYPKKNKLFHAINGSGKTIFYSIYLAEKLLTQKKKKSINYFTL